MKIMKCENGFSKRKWKKTKGEKEKRILKY